MKSCFYGILVAALVAAFPLNAEANPRGKGIGGPGIGFGIADPTLMVEFMSDHLDLDDTQRASLENIVAAMQPEAEALRERFRANHEALQSLDTDDPAYETTLNNLAVSQGRLATEGVLLATRVRTEIRAVLTDEQVEKLERGRERMQNRMRRFKNN